MWLLGFELRTLRRAVSPALWLFLVLVFSSSFLSGSQVYKHFIPLCSCCYFLRQDCAVMEPGITLNCNVNWPQTWGNPPASTWVLKSQGYAFTPDFRPFTKTKPAQVLMDHRAQGPPASSAHTLIKAFLGSLLMLHHRTPQAGSFIISRTFSLPGVWQYKVSGSWVWVCRGYLLSW